jgi:hypothetical protein
MPDRRLPLWLGLTALGVAVVVFLSLHERNITHEARFDLGRNIMETARKTGLPHFDVTDDFGFIEYDVPEIPRNFVVKFDRPGLEVSWPSLFAFTLSTDHNRDRDDKVQLATLQLSNRALHSDAEAQKFVEDTLAQFVHGKWQRFIPDECPRVTGRSSLLDASGAMDPIGFCPIDPGYRIPPELFVTLLRDQTRRWMWHGDGVYAEFNLRSMKIGNENVYTAFLEFKTDDYVKASNAALEEQYPSSPAERIGNAKKEREAIDVMEAAAIRRGDRVLTR